VKFAVERLIRIVVVFFIVTFATMMLINLTPGDPAVLLAGSTATKAQLAAVRVEYGFNRSIPSRYVSWLHGIFTGNWSRSYQTNQPVLSVIRQRLPITLELAVLAMIIAIVIAVPFGLYAAYKEGSIIDKASAGIATGLVSVPGFVLALLLVSVLGVSLRWLPVSGWVPLTSDPAENLRYAILPAAVLGISQAAFLQPVLRSDTLHTLQQDYITLARAKGMKPHQILLHHGLRPSSISLVTLLGLGLAALFGGTVIVEQIFSIPGIGSLLISSILNKDLITVQGVVTLIAIAYLAMNLVVDLLYPVLDPRVEL
jgi:peptide/nickel transport system permease protein